jgi:hypothetical protein
MHKRLTRITHFLKPFIYFILIDFLYLIIKYHAQHVKYRFLVGNTAANVETRDHHETGERGPAAAAKAAAATAAVTSTYIRRHVGLQA